MLPKPGPELFAIRLGNAQPLQFRGIEEAEPSLAVGGWQFIQRPLDLEEEHEPMGLAFIALFADQAGEVQVGGPEKEP